MLVHFLNSIKYLFPIWAFVAYKLVYKNICTTLVLCGHGFDLKHTVALGPYTDLLHRVNTCVTIFLPWYRKKNTSQNFSIPIITIFIYIHGNKHEVLSELYCSQISPNATKLHQIIKKFPGVTPPTPLSARPYGARGIGVPGQLKFITC